MVVKSKVKYIQSLSQKKVRDEEGVFVAEGPKIINELLSEPAIQLQELFAVKEWLEENHINPSDAIHEIDDIFLSRLSSLTTPNQVIGVFRKPARPAFIASGQITLILEHLQDPGNLGTIIRCADWFGVKQIVCTKDSADAFNPKVIQSSMGSIARIQVYYEDVVTLIRNHPQVKVYAAVLDGKNIGEMKPLSEGMIVIGNESKGISDDVLRLASDKITIPRTGRAESLNAAVATGIILSHLSPVPSHSRS